MMKNFLLISRSTEIHPESGRLDLRHFVLTWWLRIQQWRHNARSRRQLANLPDWLRRDIGLTEQQIRQEIRKKFWQ